MGNNSYVLLTGGKNNAGDFLIKHRAIKLFESLRTDRQIIDMDAWNLLTDAQLEVINASKALILTGGPALQPNMYPGIYPLRAHLDDIKVPILTMGIGWKSQLGEWSDTYDYPLTPQSKALLKRIDASGYKSSVRDYHTLNVLMNNGYESFVMTGCPAYYSLPHIGSQVQIQDHPATIGFSLGVTFINSPSMEALMKDNILQLKALFPKSKIIVAFHHSLDAAKIGAAYATMEHHLKRHLEFAQWLKEHNISYKDISGAAEHLIDFYTEVDWHIGYRVHAHIFCNSISKFSILLAEDGRGKATKDVIGGHVINSFNYFKKKNEMSFLDKVKYVTKIDTDRYVANAYATKDMTHIIRYQKDNGFEIMQKSRLTIDANLSIMKSFIQQLP